MADFEFAIKKNELADGKMRLVELMDRLVIVFRVGDDFYCIDDVCTHDGGTLSDGECHQFEIACPRHGARFDIRNGRALSMPATQDTGSHEVQLVGDDVMVRLAE